MTYSFYFVYLEKVNCLQLILHISLIFFYFLNKSTKYFICIIKKHMSILLTDKQRSVKNMKATGIVRRLDDLGRLVIPKEIRKQYRLKEGDSIEFFIDNDRIVIQKFDVMSKHMEEINIMCDTLHAMYQNTIIFIQEDWLHKKDIKLSETFMEACHIHRKKVFEPMQIYENDMTEYRGMIYPINAFGDWYGAFVVLYDKKEITQEETYALEAFVQLLSRQQQQ